MAILESPRRVEEDGLRLHHPLCRMPFDLGWNKLNHLQHSLRLGVGPKTNETRQGTAEDVFRLSNLLGEHQRFESANQLASNRERRIDLQGRTRVSLLVQWRTSREDSIRSGTNIGNLSPTSVNNTGKETFVDLFNRSSHSIHSISFTIDENVCWHAKLRELQRHFFFVFFPVSRRLFNSRFESNASAHSSPNRTIGHQRSAGTHFNLIHRPLDTHEPETNGNQVSYKILNDVAMLSSPLSVSLLVWCRSRRVDREEELLTNFLVRRRWTFLSDHTRLDPEEIHRLRATSNHLLAKICSKCPSPIYPINGWSNQVYLSLSFRRIVEESESIG